MKKISVRICGLLLTAVMLAGLLPAFSASAVSLEEKQRAVVLTAFAYYDKGAPVQYDSAELSAVAKKNGGAIRSTHECAPEYATPDETIYSVCSDFTYQVYYNAFGYRILGDPVTNCTMNMAKLKMGEDPICAYVFNSDTDATPRKEALTKYIAQLQPGDIINEINIARGRGHAMLYVGDCLGDGVKYLLHCSGSKYRTETGLDTVECRPGTREDIPGKIKIAKNDSEEDGAIRFQPAAEFIREHYTAMPARLKISILRPLNVITDAEYPMTQAAKGRLQFPRLVYNRTASPYTRFNDVEAGGTLTLNIELKNCSDAAYTVPVKETVPEGATFVKASDGATVSGKEIRWNVQLGAGETKVVSYDCTVTAKRGETVVFANGSAGGIPSNTLRIPVGGRHLTDAENAVFAELAEGKHRELFMGARSADVPVIVWQKLLGLNVKLPTMKELLNNVLEKSKFNDKTLYGKRGDPEGEWKTCTDMLVPEFAGGFLCSEMDSLRRVLDLRCDYLQPGDVVYEIERTAAPPLGKILVYLGDGQFLRQSHLYGAAVEDFFALQKAHTYELFFALRPTLAYDDVHAMR